MASIDQYLRLFADCRPLIDGGSNALMNARRDEAAHLLADKGLPTLRTERYRYCDVEQALRPDYGVNLNRHIPAADPYRTYRCGVPTLSTTALRYVVNDSPAPAAPAAPALPEGLTICSLTEAADCCPALMERYYHRAAAEGADSLAALNTMLAQDGLLVHVAAGVHIADPVQIVQVMAATRPLMANRRLLVVAEAGATLPLLICDHATSPCDTLATHVTEVYAEAGAHVSLYRVEETNARHVRLANVYAHVGADATLCCHDVTLTCGLSRTTTDIVLAAPGAHVTADGAVVADGQQKADHNLLIDHRAPECTSDLYYKYVLDDHATGAYAGRVLVRPGAQHTQSDQTNANMCAATTAHAWSQPMLEIYADDVRCNHGSSTGKLDDAALFYMQQRGIPEAEARLLLRHAFINDVLQRIALEPLRERLSYLVEKRFRGHMDACGSCAMCSGKH